MAYDIVEKNAEIEAAFNLSGRIDALEARVEAVEDDLAAL